MLTWQEAIQELEKRRNKSAIGGGIEKIESQHLKGKLTARERIQLLFDEHTFVELYGFIESRIDDFDLCNKRVLGDGVIVGYGKINGKLTFATSEDFTVIGGTSGEYHALKISKTIDMAVEMKAPLICINDSGGARIEEGISSLSGYGSIFLSHTKASGVIPQIAVVLGPCSGGACYGPALCDFIFIVNDISKMFITGPDVVKTVINETISMDELGGASIHAKESGVVHFCYDTEQTCIENVKLLLNYLPQNNTEHKKDHYIKVNLITNTLNKLTHISKHELNMRLRDKEKRTNFEEIVPDNLKKPYDMHKVLNEICDKNSFFEIQMYFAMNSIIGFGLMQGETVAFVCNQPLIKGGAIDCDASDKMARFVRFCDCFHIPIITLVDVPAFWPGKEQEHAGIIRHGAKLVYAYSEAQVPKITVILRKAYGGAYIAMNSMSMGADVVYAWPIAEIAVMGAEGAVNIISKKRINIAINPELEKQQCMDEYQRYFLNPYKAASRGYVTEVIKPNETREKIINALHMLKSKGKSKGNSPMKRHGNIPL